MRLRAFRKPPDGGKASLRAPRIFDRCTACRRSWSPGALSATAPKSQAMARPSRGEQHGASRRVGDLDGSAAPTGPQDAPPERSRDARRARRRRWPRSGARPPARSRAHRGTPSRRPAGPGPMPAAEEGADEEAAEAEYADDQAVLIAPGAQQQREADDRPVDPCHEVDIQAARGTRFAVPEAATHYLSCVTPEAGATRSRRPRKPPRSKPRPQRPPASPERTPAQAAPPRPAAAGCRSCGLRDRRRDGRGLGRGGHLEPLHGRMGRPGLRLHARRAHARGPGPVPGRAVHHGLPGGAVRLDRERDRSRRGERPRGRRDRARGRHPHRAVRHWSRARSRCPSRTRRSPGPRT